MADPFELDDAHHPADVPPLSQQAQAAAAPYLGGLNPEQREAVSHTGGPLLVLAGAGTGKTRALTTRLAHILATGQAWPGQILAVTFTNKAAREMKERIRALIGDMVEGMAWLGTFHSIGVKFLQRHAELAGLKSGFSILDTDDQLRLLKQLMAAENIDEKRFPARQLAGMIDDWKNRGLTPDRVPAGEAAGFAHGKAGLLYGAYQQRLKTLNAVDFGDLLLLPLKVLQANADLLADYRQRFRHILVDEYQDTNVAQYLLLRLLAGENGNICCVGDDDQSIYGWRGAQVENILRFKTDFPAARIVRLVRNYRSTAHILSAANGLIAHNKARLGKELVSELGEGEKVVVRAHWDDAEEARAISDDLEAIGRHGGRLSRAAVLVRASFQMRPLEERFIEIGLPYQVIGGPRFYERAEVRDALAYLKVIHAPAHDLAFARIINVPKRGIGKTTEQKLHAFARAEGVALYRAAELLVQREELAKRARAPLAALLADFARWRALAADMPPAELAGVVLDESGYVEMWKKDTSPKAEGRLDNLKELVRSMQEYDTLGGFLEHVALVMEADQAAAADKVTLMTMHAAKGLEFDTVFLPGWEEGLFPHQRALDENGEAGLEEERRLAYVALTRAKRRAVISFAANRQVHGLWQNALPSRFIDELPKAHVEIATPAPFMGRPMPADDDMSHWRGPDLELKAAADPPGRAACRFAVGQRIFHQKFGYGIITAADGDKLTISFEKAGRKRVMAAFVEAA
ncbi:MAG TPA: ATP-dependent DNA helicase [Thermopetrobacter sp.]|nr:ATP-dependent DNA helicase [Thermopetrobacter sp.]